MKLFYSPGACSLAAHIALREAGISPELVHVNIREKRYGDGLDYWQIHPQGYVPALQLKNGDILTEGPAILQYIADQAPAANLAPANGSFARYKLQASLNFIATELHKNFTPFFTGLTEQERPKAEQRLHYRLAQMDKALGDQPYLLAHYSVADIYLFVVLGWANLVNIDLSHYAALSAFLARVAARPAVQASLMAEGLLTSTAN